MEIPIFKEIVIIFTLSIAVLLVCHRLGLPSVVGFLLTGILCGPHGLGLVKGVDDVQNLSTIGVVLLLFTVGMEFSIKNIVKYKLFFFAGGTLQVFFTILICLIGGRFFLSGTWGGALFLGFLISLSSTAIVLKILEERGDSESPHGRLILAILIFQDIIAIPMMLTIPILAGVGEEFDEKHLYNLIKGIGILFILAFVAFRGVPKLLYYITRTRSRELFLLSLLTICFVVAWITSSLGLSLSLGAFLAGLVISESDYSNEAVGNILPFQEIFTSFFFVSMGMLLDMNFVILQPFLIFGMTLLILVLKFFVAGGSALVLGMPLRSALISGVALSQVGEFSFVLAHSGMNYGLATESQYQLFLAVSLLTMIVTPSWISFSKQISKLLSKLPLSLGEKIEFYFFGKVDNKNGENNDHIIIVGFGLRGKYIARGAKEAHIPYVILEVNPEIVHEQKLKGEPINFGDPIHPSVLIHAGVKSARTLAIVINDYEATIQIIKIAKSINPDVHILTRSRYFQEVQYLIQSGADEAIPDEFGSSLEIFARVMQKHDISQEQINKSVIELRSEGYNMLRSCNREISFASWIAEDLSDSKIEHLTIEKGSVLIGKTLAESGLKKDMGLTVLVIKRNNSALENLGPETILCENDSLIVVGSPGHLKLAKSQLQVT